MPGPADWPRHIAVEQKSEAVIPRRTDIGKGHLWGGQNLGCVTGRCTFWVIRGSDK